MRLLDCSGTCSPSKPLKSDQMPTIYDVASQAKVSIAAVSLVMNDANTTRVGEAKRQEILRVARRIGYTPSGIARALSEGSTRIIGLVIPLREPIFFHPFIAEVLSGMQNCVSKRDYHLMIYSHTAGTGRVTRGEIQQSRYADGVIVLNTRMSTSQDMTATIEELRTANIPFVMVNGYSGSGQINYVGIDDEETGRAGAQYLFERGHTRIGLLCGVKKSPISASIVAGYKHAMRNHHLPYSPSLCVHCEYEPELIRQAVSKWMNQRERPTAIFCADDQFAPTVYAALRDLGLKVPSEVAVLARGSTALAEHVDPKLTTITVPGVEIGERAAEQLIKTLKSSTAHRRRIILPCALNERESC
jgi:DNA-binding LacI/PurR family transcriptional regulator